MDPAKERCELVERLRRMGYVSSDRVAQAFQKIPRERFLPSFVSHRAYEDLPIHIGHKQTISAPHMVAIMTEAIEARPGMRVLEVGTGSGYQAAILWNLIQPGGRLTSIERVPVFRDRARSALHACGIDDVELVVGDGSLGHPEGAPYDRIIVTAAAPSIPPPLREQLAVGGVLLIPVGDERSELMRVQRMEKGWSEENLGPCAFVPLRGVHGHRAGPFAS